MKKGNTARAILIALIVLLGLTLAGVLYVLLSVTDSPKAKPVLANKPGVQYVWQAVTGPFGNLDHPCGVAFDGKNSIYVTEPTEGKVLVFDKDGSNGRIFVQGHAGETSATPAVLYPSGIDVGKDGSVYVADSDKNAVVVFNPEGKQLRELPFKAPTQVNVTGDKLYVASNGTLYVTDLAGNALGQYGTWGQRPDQFSGVSGIAVDATGRIYLTDLNNYRVLALSPTLDSRVWQLGAAATTDAAANQRKLGGPSGITIGGDGNVYFLDGIQSTVYILDKSGKVVSDPLGGAGSRDDQLYLPKSIDWVEGDTFVIADTFHNRIVALKLNPQVKNK